MNLTAKEKAKELFGSMYNVDDVMGNYTMCFDTAKKCALIVVEEILNEVPTEVLDTYKGEVNFVNNDRYTYWQEVKEGLIKLKQ